jgi:hypothetical protein
MLRVDQLAPELAESVSRSEAVISWMLSRPMGRTAIPGRSETPKSVYLKARLVSRTSFLPPQLWRLLVNSTAPARAHSR